MGRPTGSAVTSPPAVSRLIRAARRRPAAAAGLVVVCLAAGIAPAPAALASGTAPAQPAGARQAVPTDSGPRAAAEAPQPLPADSGVGAAEAQAREARDRHGRTGRALDAAAAAYEHAYAHQLRLADDLAAATVAQGRAAAAAAAAQARFRARVGSAYRHPTAGLAVADAVLHAPDTPNALHRAVLWRRLAAGGATEVRRVSGVTETVASDATAVRVVAAGTSAAVAQWRRQADALVDELARAAADVTKADRDVELARAAQAEAAAAATAAQERRRTAAAAGEATGAAPLPGAAPCPAPPSPSSGADGRVCPVGGPNGFIDSWGFPRSGGRRHEGVDMFAAYGTPVYAVADGTIRRVYVNPLGGLAINLVDDAQTMYYYAHLSSASVRDGQRVAAGDAIGAVGTSGNARGTPPHLHWQTHPGGGAAVNPFPLASALCR